MRFTKIMFSAIFLCALLTFVNCEHHDKQFSLCGCTGPSIENISEGGLVVLTVSGYRLITVSHGYMNACNAIPDSMKVDGKMISFVGRTISNCTKVESDVTTSLVSLDSLESRDTLYQTGPIIIKILKTEDYGEVPGFGYTLKNSTNDFNIIQLQIPGGTVKAPFATKLDALKIAFLVASKLQTANDFPDVLIADLHYLKIQGY